jgi:hypothetical protein
MTFRRPVRRAVSISIGSSRRDKTVEVELLGERVLLERIGTDGDMEGAARLYQELDGQVDAFGVGGADLGLRVDDRWYPLYSVRPMVRFITRTPVVDGEGLKNTLEARLAPYIDEVIGGYIRPRRVFVVTAVDRWGMTSSFMDAGYECTFGDMMFALGLPVALHTLRSVKALAAVLMPVAGRLPFKWMYPTGEKQEKRSPKWGKWYRWATVIAGDGNYIRRHMPEQLEGKVIATNTTTPEDVELFRRAGVKYLITSTPVFGGRSFGTNLMEAALIAASGVGRRLTHEELSSVIDRLEMQPQVRELN